MKHIKQLFEYLLFPFMLIVQFFSLQHTKKLIGALLFTALPLYIYAAPSAALVCQDIDDNNLNSTSPGVAIPGLDGITHSTIKCIKGYSDNAESRTKKEDYYYFTVNKDGVLLINTSSPNNHKYHFQVWKNGNNVYGNTTAINHNLGLNLNAGDKVIVWFKETGKDKDKYQAIFTFKAGATGNFGGDRPFTVRNPVATRNIAGNYAIIGNSNQCAIGMVSSPPWIGTCVDSYSNSFASKYIDIDNDSSTVNSTSSTLNIQDFVPHRAKVVWAGLYWQGVVHNSNVPGDFMGTSGQANGTTIKSEPMYNTYTQINFSSSSSTYGAEKVKFKVPGGQYVELTADVFDFYKLGYAGFKDVTNMINQTDPNGIYAIADIKSNQGIERHHGNFASWSLVVIYEDATEDLKNITLFDGYVTVDTRYKENLTIKGFLTPKIGPIKSKLAMFATDGDNGSNTLQIINQAGRVTNVANQDNPANALFDSTISRSIDRTPDTTSLRTDLKVLDFVNVLNPLESSVTLKPRTGGDRYIPSFFIMSSDLYVPEICYDYTMFVDSYRLDSVDNGIETSMGAFNSKLVNRMFIQSKEGNFNFTDVNLTYHLPQTSIVKYDQGTLEIAQNGQYNYVDASSRIISQSNAGFEMRIGNGQDSDIYPNEARYIRFDDTIRNSANDTYFELSLSAMIDFGMPGVQPIPFTKTFNQDDICGDDNGSYNVQYTTFNVVEPKLGFNTYNLFTKVAGQKIDYEVYAYDYNNLNNKLNIDLKMPVEIEMIKADDFERNATISCGDKYAGLSELITPHKVVYMEKNKGSFSFTPDETRFSYPSLSMRIHYFVDDNNTIMIDHNCSKDNVGACKPLYNTYSTTLTHCNADCSSSSSQNCFDCLKTYYDNFSCARDNFAIRPAAFSVALKDSNQNDDATQPANHIGDNSHNTSSSHLPVVSGYKYRMDINATSIGSNNAVKMYIQPFTDIHNKYMTMFWDPAATATNCVDTEDKNLTTTIYNGSSIHPRLHTAQLIHVDQIGDYRFDMSDENITRYDWHSHYLGHHAKAHFIGNKADCLAHSNADIPDSDGRVGCVTNTKVSLYQRFYPYAFDISGISIGAGPTLDRDIVYYNTLDGQNNYPQGFANTGDKNMSYNIQGTFYAVDYENNQTTNFVKNCYADDVDVSLRYRYLSPAPTSPSEYLIYDLVDYNTTNSSIVYRSDRNLSISSRTVTQASNTNYVKLAITQNSSDFATDMKGAITMDLGYNRSRDISTPINPQSINFIDFNVTDNTQPTTLYVDMKNDHKIFKDNDDFDQNITFAYATVATSKYIYDGVTDPSVATPIYTYIYCDLGYTQCANRGLDLLQATTNHGKWWKDNNFDNISKQDGDIELRIGTIYQGAGHPAINPSSVGINSNGTNAQVTVSQGPNATLPLEVGIDFVTDTTKPAYTDRWLIFNPDDNTKAPIPFYKVRFIGDSIWTGVGKTGNVVNTNASSKKTERLDW